MKDNTDKHIIIEDEGAYRFCRKGKYADEKVIFKKHSPLFDCFEPNTQMYFVHSYQVKLEDDNNLDAYCHYESRITAAIRKGNIFGTQFHPEKSQDMGLKVLENFIKWNP